MTTRMMIQGWHHQSRDTNLMVNQLANMAIDGGSSRQARLEGDTTVRQHWEHVTRYMEADLAPWIVNMENTAQEDAVAASQSGRRQEMGRRKPGPGRRSS
ncbi:hypothetical protein PR003_g13329 [Phytophthora rubi]|uniref:RNase H type-1 domain-containing protein n=1 Tax=Phytophthora rubi TaxID=129364 RepID=A0A6A4EXN9_9STRA|nr:hypothetical protein PR003_g13329 [Phytophthora rubi]